MAKIINIIQSKFLVQLNNFYFGGSVSEHKLRQKEKDYYTYWL